MKKILLLLCTTLCLPFVACEKEKEKENIMKYDSSGIYINDECVETLGSAFVGGGIADPKKGSSIRCHLYHKYFRTGPNWNEVKCSVYLHGFKYTGKEYSTLGRCLEGIEIVSNVLENGVTLIIPLEQGEYKGRCEQVTDVKINSFKTTTKDGLIDIDIKLKDGRSLCIFYFGEMPYDGYY